MVIMAIMPYVEVMGSLSLLILRRIYDTGTFYMFKKGGDLSSKCVTKQQYVDIFTGPEYLIHFRYS